MDIWTLKLSAGRNGMNIEEKKAIKIVIISDIIMIVISAAIIFIEIFVYPENVPENVIVYRRLALFVIISSASLLILFKLRKLF